MKFSGFWIGFLAVCLATLCLAEDKEKDEEHIADFAKGKAEQHEDHNPIPEEHFKDGQHNVEFDHDAIIGSQQAEVEFDQLPPELAMAKLREFARRMDTDHDEFVSQAELVDWILHSFRSLDDEEASTQMKEQDVNHDERISWNEYLEKVYGYSAEEMAEFKKDKSKDMHELLEMVEWDKKKFEKADDDKDGYLAEQEFQAFMHPHNYPHMYELEVERALADHDKNKDGHVQLSEYLGEGEHDKETEIYQKEQFAHYDKNKDGKLTGEEIKAWILPDFKEMAEDEAQHLFRVTDVNKDNKLSYDEIVQEHSTWVGSQATDYGRHLHDPSEL